MYCLSSDVATAPFGLVLVQPQLRSQTRHQAQLDILNNSSWAVPHKQEFVYPQRQGGRRGSCGGCGLIVPGKGRTSVPKDAVRPDQVDDFDEFCAELLSQLVRGGDGWLKAAEHLHGRILELVFDKSGCRVVQAAIEVANQQVASALCSELKGFVRKAIRCPHANHAIQQIVQVLPPSHVAFIVQELLGAGKEIARHRYGCRVLCRLMEHHSCAEHIGGDTAVLVDEVVKDASELCRHSFGHHVVQSILEHGTSQHRDSIITALSHDMFELAGHRSASYVVEKALVFGSLPAREFMALELIKNVDHFLLLAEGQFGCRVIAAVLRTSGDVSQTAQVILKSSEERLQMSKYGRRTIQDLKRCSKSASF